MAAALAALGIAAGLRAAEPEEKKTPGPEEKKAEAPKPPPELDKLNYFVAPAPWTLDGTLKAGPGGPTPGRSMCRWMPGKFFLGCMMEFKDSAGTITQAESMMGWDAEKKTYRSWSFDNQGRYESATGTVKDDVWTWVGESHRGDKTTQTRYVVSDTKPDAYAFSLETSSDGKSWTPVWSGKATKMAARTGMPPGATPAVTSTVRTPTPAPK
jgi:hypothetical protein